MTWWLWFLAGFLSALVLVVAVFGWATVVMSSRSRND